MPKFFQITFKELLESKHPTAWVEFERSLITEGELFAKFFQDGRIFDGAALVEHMGHRKPSPESFHCAVSHLQVPSSDLLLIDDRQQNVAAARAAGLQAIRFESAEQVLFKQSTTVSPAVPVATSHQSKLVLRSINSTRSAYMSVTFDARFFDEYHVFNCTVVQAGILMKRVHKIVFELTTVDSRAVVTLHCDNGLLKSYKIPSMDAEILQATVDKEAFPTCVVAESGAMSKLLSSFHSGLEEVTIIAYGEAGRQQQGAVPSKAVQLHSFLDPLKGHVDKSLFTQLAVDTREVFLSYSHNSGTAEGDADVTFNLKDFKAMLSLCENLNSNVMLRFEGPGQPLVVEPHFPTALGQEVDYEAELILATLSKVLEVLAGHPAASSWHKGGAAGTDSPGPVPSGLLEEPLEEFRSGGAGGRVGPPASSSRRSRPSRLCMPAAAGEQRTAMGGLPAGSTFELIDRNGKSWEAGAEGDDEIPSTPPERRHDGQELASIMPGAIPTQRPTAQR
ncbi:hypothetical protein N2152v2_005760 [Parachlorella kessleri]